MSDGPTPGAHPLSLPQVRSIVLFGLGGHALDVLSVLAALTAEGHGFNVVGGYDDDSSAKPSRHHIAHLGPTKRHGEHLELDWVVAIGYPSARREVAHLVERRRPLPAAALVHPLCDRAFDVDVRPGAIVFGQSRLSPGARLGEHSFVSYHASVGHGTSIGAFSSVMPGAAVGGDVVIGESVLIGSNATILQGRTVGSGAVVGAGAVVDRDVPPNVQVMGIPAKPRVTRTAQ